MWIKENDEHNKTWILGERKLWSFAKLPFHIAFHSSLFWFNGCSGKQMYLHVDNQNSFPLSPNHLYTLHNSWPVVGAKCLLCQRMENRRGLPSKFSSPAARCRCLRLNFLTPPAFLPSNICNVDKQLLLTFHNRS